LVALDLHSNLAKYKTQIDAVNFPCFKVRLDNPVNLEIKQTFETFLRGFGQIMLQESSIAGILFLVGIGLNSLTMLLGGVLASISGIVTARLLNYDKASINRGLFGFNSALVGTMIFFQLAPSALTFGCIIIGGVLSSIITHLMHHHMPRFPAFTAPFVITGWVIILLADLFEISTVGPQTLILDDDAFFATLRGIGQIMFQEYWLTGALFLTGVYMHSKIAAIGALSGSILGIAVGRIFGFPDDLVAIGIYSFNASLVGIALVDYYGKNIFPTVMGILISILLSRAFDFLPLPGLTAPFVLSCWIIIGFTRTNVFSKTTGLDN
jgi:urea transporter